MTTSASTAPPISSREDIWLRPIRPPIFSEAAVPETTEEHRHGRPYVRMLSSRASDREVFFPGACYRVDLGEFSGDTVNREITFLRYWESCGSVIVVDFGERTSEFPEEQQEVVERLRRNSRPILSDKLVTMLRDVQEDPDSPPVNIVSLRQMASLLINQPDFADPFIGPDNRGFVYAQWRIVGNGVLVIRFPDDERILLIAQADETSEREELDISVEGPKSSILEEYRYLVPSRQ